MSARSSGTALVPLEHVMRTITSIRGCKVMLDADLALIYGVTTKRLNEQVKRNRSRFPKDFMFRLTAREKTEVVANCDHLHRLRFSPTLPFAFTEHGAVMLANVLNSVTAVRASIHIVRAFVRLRATLAAHAELSRRLDALEHTYDRKFTMVFQAIRHLMEPLETPAENEPIGFRTPRGANRPRTRPARRSPLAPLAHAPHS